LNVRPSAVVPLVKIALIIIACLIGIVLLVVLVRSRIVATYSVTAREIPEVISQLQQSGKNGNFAVVIFIPPGSTDGEAVNLQYSIEGGIVGFDWVLIGPRNVTDRTKVSEIASKLGHHLEEHEMNNVHYLRLTGPGISELGAIVIQDLYKIDPGTKLEMITEGFKWQP
jgi:hypothetical protein